MKLIYYTLVIMLFSYNVMWAQEWQTSGGDIYNTNTGKVGIGTVSPETTLDVNGSFAFLNGVERLLWSSKHIGETDHRNYLAPRLSDDSDWDWGQEFGYHHHYRAWYFDGNVGIGTSNPSEKLHINGGLFMNAGEGFKILGDPNFFGSAQDGIIFQMQDVNATGGNTDGGFVFRGHTPTDGAFQNWMVIKTGGNVGIGTTTPDAKLAVNGDIHTKEVRVDMTGWPDFVFNKDYSLPTLEEVETHIKANGHLKDIPSEAEVKANGINLGEMDAKLLQKIEELTLYTIEQQKQLQLLQQQNEQLIERIEILENQIKAN